MVGFLVLGVFLTLAIGLRTEAVGQEFYKGKTVRFIVGFSPGGGFDTYTRLIGRHISKYIPGQPQTLVENMPGAGSLIAANHLYKNTKPDGLTVAQPNTYGTYIKFTTRSSEDRPCAGVAALVRRSNGNCEEARIVVGAVSSAPVIVADQELQGRKINPALIGEIGPEGRGCC